jgi:SAM-dependent methyltransferase
MSKPFFDPIPMSTPVTADNFEESAYVAANPDVKRSIDDGTFRDGHDHFVRHGYAEGRLMSVDPAILKEARALKMKALSPHLRNDMEVDFSNGKANYLTSKLRKAWNIISTDNVSAHNYDPNAHELINSSDGLVLDCGAGRRPVYYSNVVNFEIVDYDTTDVVGVGEDLPFKDNSFGGVISIAVLEHVKDPFRCAKEIIRVLKPGGKLFACVPFLQPLHAFPHHYYNMTHTGLKSLFDGGMEVDRQVVLESGHPIHTLSWLIRSWLMGLNEETAKSFMDKKVSEFLETSALLPQPFCAELSEEKNFELACATSLFAHKKPIIQDIASVATAK